MFMESYGCLGRNFGITFLSIRPPNIPIFQIVYRRDPPPMLPFDKGVTVVSSVEQSLLDRYAALQELKLHLQPAQRQMKRTTDRKRRDIQFEVDELVYLKLKMYHQHSVTNRWSANLSLRYYGPFKVSARVGQVAYKLKLPPRTVIHPMFHVSQLRKVIGAMQAIGYLPTRLAAHGQFLVEPESVLRVRLVQLRDLGQRF